MSSRPPCGLGALAAKWLAPMMSRKNFSKIAIVLLALSFLESGCSLESGKATQSKPTRWNMTRIEAKIKNWAKLKEIHLTDKQNGKYEGTGTGEDGLLYKSQQHIFTANSLTRLNTNFTLTLNVRTESSRVEHNSMMV
jgi:apolipoprotein N-acyltransferase